MSGRFGPVDTEDGETRRDPVAPADGADGGRPRNTDAEPATGAVRDTPPDHAVTDAGEDAPDRMGDAADAAPEADPEAAALPQGPDPAPAAESPLPRSESDPVAATGGTLGDGDADSARARDGNSAGTGPLLLLQPTPAPDEQSSQGVPQDRVHDAPAGENAPVPDAGRPATDPSRPEVDGIEAESAEAVDAEPEGADREAHEPAAAEADQVVPEAAPPDQPTAKDAAPDDAAPGAVPPASRVAGDAGPADATDAAHIEPVPQDTGSAEARSVWDAPPVAPPDTEAEAAEEAEGITASDPWDAATLRAAADDGAPYLAAPGTDANHDAAAVTEALPSPAATPAAAPEPTPEPAPAPEPEPVEMALFGKLAARGDFITRNVPRPLQRPLEDWLSRVMNGSREVLGAHWDQAYVSAPAWFFWIGAEAFEDARSFAASNLQSTQIGVLTGVLVPSADRLGRRFPLTLLLGGARARALPPPTIGPPDHGWYGALAERALHFRQASDLAPVEVALGAMPGPRTHAEYAEVTAVPPGQPLWAQAGYGGLAEMWHDLSRADHALAASGRSYWWTGGLAAGAVRDDQGAPSAEGCGAQVISVTGLPDPDVFAFMLRCQAT